MKKCLSLGILSAFILFSCSKTSSDPVPVEPTPPPQPPLQQGPSGEICFFNYWSDSTVLTTMHYDGTGSKAILKEKAPLNFSQEYQWAKWSFDKNKILFSSNRDGGDFSDIYSINKDGSGLTRVTHTEAYEFYPSLSPDGKSILYVAFDPNRNTQLFVCHTDGSNARQLTGFSHASRKVYCQRPVWSADGTTIYFNANKDTTAYNIYSVGADGTNPKRITTNTAASDWGPSVSKSGKIAFYSVVNNVSCLFTVNADGSGRTQVTNLDSGDPVWSPDGNYIAFISDKDRRTNGTPGTSSGEDIYTIKADGTELKRLTNMEGIKYFFDWK